MGGVTFRGEEGVFLLEGVFMKWEKISVWWRRNSNLLAWSSACGRGDGERKGREGRKRGGIEKSGIKDKNEGEREEKEKSGIKNEKGGRKEDKGEVEKREGRKREEKRGGVEVRR